MEHWNLPSNRTLELSVQTNSSQLISLLTYFFITVVHLHITGQLVLLSSFYSKCDSVHIPPWGVISGYRIISIKVSLRFANSDFHIKQIWSNTSIQQESCLCPPDGCQSNIHLSFPLFSVSTYPRGQYLTLWHLNAPSVSYGVCLLPSRYSVRLHAVPAPRAERVNKNRTMHWKTSS